MLPIPLAVISLGVLKVLPPGSIQDSRLDPKTGKSCAFDFERGSLDKITASFVARRVGMSSCARANDQASSDSPGIVLIGMVLNTQRHINASGHRGLKQCGQNPTIVLQAHRG
jgi:hypothetical protein